MNRYSAKLTPSPSMVVAIIALVVALSGSAYAAVTINGKNIKKGTITAKQVKDKSLTGTDIKNESLTGADIKNATVGNSDLTDASVGNSKLADGSVSASKLAAGTVIPPPIGTVTSTTAYSPPTSLSYSDIPGMSLNYTAPPGTTKLILTFSAECSVSYTSDAQFLGAQVVVDGVAADPDDAANQFCTVDPLDNYAQVTSTSITRTIDAGPGPHAIKAQAVELLLSNGSLDNMIITVTPSS